MMLVEANQMSGPIPKRWKKNKYREQAAERRKEKSQSEKSAVSEKKKTEAILV